MWQPCLVVLAEPPGAVQGRRQDAQDHHLHRVGHPAQPRQEAAQGREHIGSLHFIYQIFYVIPLIYEWKLDASNIFNTLTLYRVSHMLVDLGWDV